MAARRATLTSNQPARKDSISHHQPITSLDDCKKKELPHGFAETILDLEILLDNVYVEIEKVKELLELYMIGVEYYESVGDQRFVYFNKKMSNLMMKPNVIDAMSRGQENNNSANNNNKNNNNNTNNNNSNSSNNNSYDNGSETQIKSKEEAMREAEIRHKEENIRKTVNYSHQDNDEKAKAIVKNVQQEIKQNQKIIHDSLDTQKRLLFERLQNRRSRTLTKASSVPVLGETFSSDNDDSSQDGSAVITSRIDFSSIANAIREDDQEDDNDEEQKKQMPRKLSTLDKIKKFKEEILNGKTSPTNINETRSNRNSFSSSNKVRSNSQANQMQKRNSTYSKMIREKKISIFNKSRRRVKSKTVEQLPESTDNEVLIRIEQLQEWQQQVNTCLNTIITKQIEPFQVNINFKSVIQEKQEEDDESSSPIKILKKHK